MKKINYDFSSNKKHEEVRIQIINILKEKGLFDNLDEYITSLAALAIVYKKTSNCYHMLDYIKKHIDNEITLDFLTKVAIQYEKSIEWLALNNDVDTLKAVVLLDSKIGSERDYNTTPIGLTKLAISLLQINENDTVLDLGSGVGTFLFQAAISSESKCFYGVEINVNNVIMSTIRKFIAELPIYIIPGNMLSDDFSYISANKVFSNFPFNARYSSLQNDVVKNPKLSNFFSNAKKTVSGDWIFALSAFLNTAKPGRTVIIMANGGTWNNSDEEIRKKVVEMGIIEGIILLPERLLSFTSIQLIMLVFSQDNKFIRMVDASNMYTTGRRQNYLEKDDVEKILDAYYNNSENSRLVTIDEIQKHDYILNPKRYIGVENSVYNTITLGEVCKSINRGAMISSAELDKLVCLEETEHQYLMLQNINDGLIDQDLPYLTHIDEKYQKYCVKNGDLIISKNAPFKVALVKLAKNKKILANGNLYFLEIDSEKINPVYVELFLQSEEGQSQLMKFAKGTVISSISIQDLKAIKIPNIPRDKQDYIAQEYESLNKELLDIQKQMNIIRSKKARLLEEC